MRAPWEWRISAPVGVMMLDTDRAAGRRLFHAYDVNHHAACDPVVGLIESDRRVTEGDDLCPDCIRIVAENPAGSDPIDYAALEADYWRRLGR